MKVLIFICILAGLLFHTSESTKCVCKCCTTDDCDSSKATPQSFDLKGVCNAVTCNRASCAIEIHGCPAPGTAGHVDSSCSEESMALTTVQVSFFTLATLLIGTLMLRRLY